jgi:hypothetical protein
MESAISLRAATLSSSSVNCLVTRGGTPSSGFGAGTTSSSALDVIVAREDGKSGGRLCEEEGCRSGVEIFEFSVEDGKTRFARRKLKNAVGRLKLVDGIRLSSCAKSWQDNKAADEYIPREKEYYSNSRGEKGTENLFYPRETTAIETMDRFPGSIPGPKYL